jgi:uncharacterized protein (TIGR00299 family) protein
MRTLYFDCFAGASGNMILGALLALGIDRREIEEELAKLDLPGISLDLKTVDRSGIAAFHVEVNAPDQSSHRHLSHILDIINGSRLSLAVKERSTSIFQRLAEAEARVHGISIEKVHFHEVGALDAIVDIVGACIGFELLGIQEFLCSKINVGSGFVTIEHGKFPVPPPAVTELLLGIPIYSNEIEGELTTPTGAAIISTICSKYTPTADVIIEKTGYGAGSRSYDGFPNVLRLILGETSSEKAVPSQDLLLIETNLDDISPQVLGYVMERAFELGALDCWFTPIQMKKNRPATMLSILAAEEKRFILAELLYTETTTLGLRLARVERECLEREFKMVATRFGDVEIKIARYHGRVVNAMPEFEQVRELAMKTGEPFRVIHQEVLIALKKEFPASAATN